MKMNIQLSTSNFQVLFLALALAGCTTVDGQRRADPVKLSQAKLLIQPVAAGAVRRVILNSPEHAPRIAKYAASVAGVFCEMSLSNQFAPEFLIAAVDKFTDPELAKVGDGYLIDVKNAAVGIYRLLWGDRFRAEVSPTNWLHGVCELFCESISQGLSAAGYPGGAKATKLTASERNETFLFANSMPNKSGASGRHDCLAEDRPGGSPRFGADLSTAGARVVSWGVCDGWPRERVVLTPATRALLPQGYLLPEWHHVPALLDQF